MNVFIICNCASGLEVFRGMLIRKLVKSGHSISAIVPVVENPKEWYSEKEIKKMGCKLIKLPMERRGMNPFRDTKLLFSYIGILNREKPDLVITYTIKPNVYGGIACLVCGVPYAANITGLGTAFQKRGILRTFVTFLYKTALRRANAVFFENIENKQIFLNERIIRQEQAHLLNGAGVDLEVFHYLPYPEDGEETRFLFIGRIMAEKGVNELFTAMRMLQKDGCRCSLDILGNFDEDYSEEIAKGETEGWLHYHGYQKDVRPFIADCHCFVLPSWHEGMANTNLECAASGRPVITSNIHGCMEAVEDGVSGYLCKRKDPEDLYEAMRRFSELSFDQRRQMGLAGRQRMEAIFDKKKVVAETIDFLSIR